MRHPEVDVVVVGMGWAGGIISAECAKAGLSVVGLERGDDIRDTELLTRAHDELRFNKRGEMVQDPAIETWTLRHDTTETALPLRTIGAFRPGAVVGGSGVAWGAVSWRLPPLEFSLRSHITEQTGVDSLPEDSSIQDWPITYEELAPHYDRFENMAGVSGTAGNINGITCPGGNPFEGPRSSEFPLPPHTRSPSAQKFAEAASEAGYHPFPVPSAALSVPFTNPDGISREACSYSGYCSSYVCEFGAKASPTVTVIPVAERSERFELRTNAYVVGVDHRDGRATGVRYIDAEGVEHEQPASVVVLAAYAFNNTRLLLLSGLGTPYDPRDQTGAVGKNFGTQFAAGGRGLFKKDKLNSFMGTTSAGVGVADFFDFDHSDVDFVGGGLMLQQAIGMTPLKEGFSLPPGTPTWGVGWKNAIREWFDRAMPISCPGQSLAYRDRYFDLDPTYRDAYGLPLIRITHNWKDNERKLGRFLSSKAAEMFTAMGADAMNVRREADAYYDVVRYQSTHVSGGAIMGDDPATSVVNRSLQMWDCDNVFVVGASAFPNAPAHAPTATVGALAYLAADSIVSHYARRQEVLV